MKVMKYILDFDGVLFDTQTLKDKMSDLGIEESLRSVSLFEDIKAADPDFDSAKLLFTDAHEFLEEHKTDCKVVSSFVSTNPMNNQDESVQREYQETKIRLCGVAAMVGEENVHVVGISKRDALETLKKECDEKDEECLFIDDRLMYVEEARSLGIFSIWMNRTGLRSKPEELHQVSSFGELLSKLEIWKR
jgi:FMN phosphatase YigB (HAD superfamily)